MSPPRRPTSSSKKSAHAGPNAKSSRARQGRTSVDAGRQGTAQIPKKKTEARSASRVQEAAALPLATVPALVLHSGSPFMLKEDFAKSALYRKHQRGMETLQRFEQVLAPVQARLRRGE